MNNNAFDNLGKKAGKFSRPVAGIFVLFGLSALISGYVFKEDFTFQQLAITDNGTNVASNRGNRQAIITNNNEEETAIVADVTGAIEPTTVNATNLTTTNNINQNISQKELQRFVRQDNFGRTLMRGGVSLNDAYLATQAASQVFPLSSLRENQVVKLDFGKDSTNKEYLRALSIRVGDASELLVNKNEAGQFVATINNNVAVDKSVKLYRFNIADNGGFAASAESAGLSAKDITNTANLLASSVDLTRDITKGDLVQILIDDDPTAFSNAIGGNVRVILVSSKSGKDNAFFYYVSEDGRASYYNNDGQSQIKMLTRTPIDGARIISGFGQRVHPVLGYSRLHKGVDFPAPIGTQIKAAGAGVVDYVGWKSGYGNYVGIRHKHGYYTAYGHMSRFADNIKVGDRVTQNQLIGYVGNTGLSTGPHLHFEIHLGGSAVNPATIKLEALHILEGNDLIKFNNAKKNDLARIQNAQIVVQK